MEQACWLVRESLEVEAEPAGAAGICQIGFAAVLVAALAWWAKLVAEGQTQPFDALAALLATAFATRVLASTPFRKP